VLPGDAKKQRKQTKQMFLDRGAQPPFLHIQGLTHGCLFPTAYEMGVQSVGCASGIPVLAVDVPTPVFEAMAKSPGWATDDEAWKAIASGFPLQSAGYAPQVREAVVRRRADGHRFILLYAVRDERVHLLTLA